MRSIALCAATVGAGFLLLAAGRGQAGHISVLKGNHISADSPKTPFAETFLAINPIDEKNLVVTSIVGIHGENRCYVYASHDAGRTWQHAKTTSADNALFSEPCGDPIVYFDSEGTALFAGLYRDLIVSRSTDGGFTWGPAVVVPGNYDREYLAIDESDGQFSGRIYAAGQGHYQETSGQGTGGIDLAISTDHGRSFRLSTVLAHRCAELESVALVDLLVTPEGKLIIPFRSRSCSDRGSEQLWTIGSEDGGVNFYPAQRGPSYTTGEMGFRHFKSGSDPRAAIDLSGSPFRGRIYVVYVDFDGGKYVVKMSHSQDSGKTWTPPIRVNDATNSGDAANAAVAVNKDGVVGVVFNGRDDTKDSCFRCYFTTSLDGGETFLPNVRASEQPTCPLAPGNWVLRGGSSSGLGDNPESLIWMDGFPDRFPNGGETQGLVAKPDGRFYSTWINGESGVMQLWSTDFAVPAQSASSHLTARNDLGHHHLTLEVGEPSLDLSSRTVSVKVQVVNSSSATTVGPIAIILKDVRSFLPELRAVNSDNGKTGKGAQWDFSLGGKTSLQPQAKTKARILRFGFAGDLPEEPLGGVFDGYFDIRSGTKQ